MKKMYNLIECADFFILSTRHKYHLLLLSEYHTFIIQKHIHTLNHYIPLFKYSLPVLHIFLLIPQGFQDIEGMRKAFEKTKKILVDVKQTYVKRRDTMRQQVTSFPYINKFSPFPSLNHKN